MTTGQRARTDPDPFRRPPLIDIPWGERQRWWDRTTRRLDERSRWRNAETLGELGDLVAQFVEGKLARTPGHWGPRTDETVEIAEPLAHANRRGFVTVNSQPGCDGAEYHGWEQRAEVDGWASPATVAKLRRLFAGTRIEVRATTERPLRTDFSDIVNVSRTVGPDGVWEHTHVGHVPGRFAPFINFNRPDLTEGAHYVTIFDPEWGDRSLLWDRLSEPDWDSPTPPEPETPAAPSRPTATPTSTGSAGGAMSSIEDVRAGIAAANESATEGLGALQQAHASLEQSQAALMAATEGSGQADVSEANGLLAQAVGSIEEVRQQVAAAISASEGVGNRL